MVGECFPPRGDLKRGRLGPLPFYGSAILEPLLPHLGGSPERGWRFCEGGFHGPGWKVRWVISVHVSLGQSLHLELGDSGELGCEVPGWAAAPNYLYPCSIEDEHRSVLPSSVAK